MQLRIYILSISIILLGICASCKKFLKVEPPKSIVDRSLVFKSDATAISAMVGVYHQMMGQGFASGSYNSITINAGLSADELYNHLQQSDYDFFYKNALNPQVEVNYNIWRSAYETIYAANAILEGVSESTTLSTGVKTQLEGEAKFIRAFVNFYLVNLYGDIPLITSTDYNINKIAARTTVPDVYAHIIQDLQQAKSLLNVNYISSEKVRPNKAAAMSLLARVYLYTGQWEKAETEAGFVLTDNRYSLETELDKVFFANSREAIWQILNPGANNYTKEGQHFILQGPPNAFNFVSLDTLLVQSFEPADQRRNKWIGSVNNGAFYYPFKYKNNRTGTPTHEYSMVLRLGELYLIRAEARAKQNKIIGLNSAASDLNAIRTRAGLLSNTTATTEAAMLEAIEQERRKELFTEWGHRWLDLKRTNSANTILSTKQNWNASDVLYPLPDKEMVANPNLVPQNPGY